MTNAIHPSAQTGFAAQAAAYAKGRPDYPWQVAGWLTADIGLHAGKRGLDLGSGTGKFLPYLRATGATITAVEPVAEMRAALQACHPDIEALEGTATRIPLADATLDAVVCAQSFHWFATPAALAEIRRVLTPGGTLGLIWNNRDFSVPWVAAIEAVTEPHLGDTPSQNSGEWRRLFPAAGFGPLSESVHAHLHHGDPDAVIIDRSLSVSYIAALPAAEQDRVIASIRAIIAGSPVLAGHSKVTLPLSNDHLPLRQAMTHAGRAGRRGTEQPSSGHRRSGAPSPAISSRRVPRSPARRPSSPPAG